MELDREHCSNNIAVTQQCDREIHVCNSIESTQELVHMILFYEIGNNVELTHEIG